MTQGLATIGEARHVVLVATGRGQGGADRPGGRGPADGDVPGVGAAAAPPRARSSSTRRAAAGLGCADYYRAVFAGKPDWQPL